MKATMSRKRKHKTEARILPPAPGRQSWIAGPCQICAELLIEMGRKQNTTVTKTVRESRMVIRYCRCENCRNTWKRIEVLPKV